jgi:osmotically-inducible protein OsmY
MINFTEKLRRVSLITGLAIILNSCLGAFVAGAAVGGAVVYDRRTAETIMTDKNIELRAFQDIKEDRALRNTHVSVTSFNRVVLLTGQVPNETLRNRILAKVRAIPKVRRIYDQMTLEQPNLMVDRSHDAWITTKVKTTMLTTEGLYSSQIKVVTENEVVYLLGLVTKQQADMAADIASSIRGVKRVVKLFEYEK